MQLHGDGLRVHDSRFMVFDLSFGFTGLGFGVHGFALRFERSSIMVHGS